MLRDGSALIKSHTFRENNHMVYYSEAKFSHINSVKALSVPDTPWSGSVGSSAGVSGHFLTEGKSHYTQAVG